MNNPIVISMEINLHEYGMSLGEFQMAIRNKQEEFFAAVKREHGDPASGAIRQKVYIQDNTLVVKMVYGGD